MVVVLWVPALPGMGMTCRLNSRILDRFSVGVIVVVRSLAASSTAFLLRHFRLVPLVALQNGVPKDVLTQYGYEGDDAEVAQVKNAIDDAAKDRTTTITPTLNLSKIREFNRHVPPEDRIPIPGSAGTRARRSSTCRRRSTPTGWSRRRPTANRRNGALSRG